MQHTTLIKRRADMRREPLPECHGGTGHLDWTTVLESSRGLNFVHDDVLAPGVSIGVHRHSDDAEYYYVLAGSGLMTLDGEEYPVSAGDMTAVFPGGSHGLVNNGDADLRILVFSVPA